MAYVSVNNQTILAAIPQPPPYFFNLTRTGAINVVGNTFYSPTRVSMLHSFQKSTGLPLIKNRFQNFIIGFLLVLLIPIVSDIVQTILLRSSSGTINSNGLYSACLVDEFSHLRNLWKHATARHDPQQSAFRNMFRMHTTKLSIFALLVASFVFFIDVIALQLSQKVPMYSSADQFNIRAFQPIGTYGWRARGIRRKTEFSPCISPLVIRPFHKRYFLLTSCIFSSNERALDKPKDISGDISFASWYHRAGSDHEISFGEGRHRIRIRAEITLSESGSTWKVLFNTFKTVMEDTQFIHNKTIHAAMQFACNKKFSQLGCLEMLTDLNVVSIVEQNRNITLWNEGERKVVENVKGLVTTFNVKMNQPFRALWSGSHFLMASSAIMDVIGPGLYEKAETGEQVDGIPRLISEQGRVAGLPSIFFTVILCIALLAMLRLCLRPVSLGSLALRHMEAVGKRRGLQKRKINGLEDGGSLNLYSASLQGGKKAIGERDSDVGMNTVRNGTMLTEQQRNVYRNKKIARGDHDTAISYECDTLTDFSDLDYENIEYS